MLRRVSATPRALLPCSPAGAAGVHSPCTSLPLPNATTAGCGSNGKEKCTRRCSELALGSGMRTKAGAMGLACDCIEEAHVSSAAEVGSIQQELDGNAWAIQEGRPTSPVLLRGPITGPEERPSTKTLPPAAAATRHPSARIGRRTSRHPTPLAPASAVVVVGLLLCNLHAAASTEPDDPCDRRCIRKLSCAALNDSLTCDETSRLLDCDCTGCCLALLSPPAPPALPPPLPPPPQLPPSPPSPLLPPLAPGRLAAGSITKLREVVEALNRKHPAIPPFPAPPPSTPPGIPLPQTPPPTPPTPPSQPPPGQPPPPPPQLPPAPPAPPPSPSPPAPPGLPSDSRVVTLSGHIALGGSPLVVRGIDLTLEGVGAEGATLDAEGLSRAIEVTDGASLTLRQIHVVNGNATTGGGGGLLVHGAGSSLIMDRASVRDSVATGFGCDWYPCGRASDDMAVGGTAACSEPCASFCGPTRPRPHACIIYHLGPQAPNTVSRRNQEVSPTRSSTFEHAGGLMVRAGGRAVLSLSTIADCAAWDGGGVFATDYANVTLQGGSRVTGCHARNCGGALALYMGSHVDILEGSVLHDCNATEWGAGMLASLNVHVRMMQSSILECSGGRGGIQLSFESTLLATGSVRAPRIELARNAAAHTRSPRYALPHPLSQ